MLIDKNVVVVVDKDSTDRLGKNGTSPAKVDGSDSTVLARADVYCTSFQRL